MIYPSQAEGGGKAERQGREGGETGKEILKLTRHVVRYGATEVK